MKRDLVKTVLTNPVYLTACGFGAGLAPKAPGTVGTAVAIPIAVAMSWLAPSVQWAVLAAMFALGCWICQVVAQSLEDSDPAVIVWDEIVGFCVAMMLIPMSPMTVVAGFVIFRTLDILKPWPISWVEKKTPGGFGIMIDDVIAGLACNVGLQVLIHFGYL
ncbi:MAG: phosphatidylglycerophosphatase A [Acidiferrobacterales bacterium]|nr:phosphatidylglycerophosphatase A [Acidiferrobacterales bacterium]